MSFNLCLCRTVQRFEFITPIKFLLRKPGCHSYKFVSSNSQVSGSFGHSIFKFQILNFEFQFPNFFVSNFKFQFSNLNFFKFEFLIFVFKIFCQTF